MRTPKYGIVSKLWNGITGRVIQSKVGRKILQGILAEIPMGAKAG